MQLRRNFRALFPIHPLLSLFHPVPSRVRPALFSVEQVVHQLLNPSFWQVAIIAKEMSGKRTNIFSCQEPVSCLAVYFASL